jgi:hypothetical protein
MLHPRLLIAAATAALLSACVVAPYPGRVVYGQPGPGYGQPVPGYVQTYPEAAYAQPGVIVDIAPPSPYVEVVPAIPYPGAYWIGGYWGWNGGRHQWVPGRWDRPRPGYAYQPHAWVQHGGRWHLNGGAWVRV